MLICNHITGRCIDCSNIYVVLYFSIYLLSSTSTSTFTSVSVSVLVLDLSEVLHLRQHFLARPKNGTENSLGTEPGTFASNHLRERERRTMNISIIIIMFSHLRTCHHSSPLSWLSLCFSLRQGRFAIVW